MSRSSPPGAKGRLVPPRNSTKKSEKEKEKVREANALKEAKKKLGLQQFLSLREK